MQNGIHCNGIEDCSKTNGSVTSDESSKIYNSNVPGFAKIYIHTWGCAHNSSDSEYMAGQLAAFGYEIVGELN